ncbi:MAG: T9SS type A sorting domain-containing protein [Saprospiraceae bacterium]|nr:T9SS type A sorting domain-containing protein [Saprospiraceae bacterium]
MKSNAFDDGGRSVSSASGFTVNLTAGTEYAFVYGDDNGITKTFTFSGAGNVLIGGTAPSGDYGYTFILVSDADNLIKAVSATADFGASGTFIAGTYKVYGISYLLAGANTASWVGQSIGAVNGTTCLLQSSNFKPLTFTATLPVELLAFEARALETQNLLTWVTASEVNNAGFEVERSNDGTNWETLDFVKGYGYSLQERNYKYYDQQPWLGVHYYRLKQLDNDGAFEYSNIVSVTTKAAASFAFTLYPNPTKEGFTLELTGTNDAPFNLQLVDQLGRVVQEWRQLEGINHTFSTSHLASGFYTVIARSEQHSFVQRLVKQ